MMWFSEKLPQATATLCSQSLMRLNFGYLLVQRRCVSCPCTRDLLMMPSDRELAGKVGLV
jgi:hypothetical protein